MVRKVVVLEKPLDSQLSPLKKKVPLAPAAIRALEMSYAGSQREILGIVVHRHT